MALCKWKRARALERLEGVKDPPESPTERARESSPVPPAAENNTELTDDDVFTKENSLTYVKEVKATFKDDPESYQKFLRLMVDLKAEKVDNVDIATRVKELFRGDTRLILGFNVYLPEGDQISPPPENPKKQQAILLRSKVEALGKRKYKAFIEILGFYMEESKGIDDVYKLTAKLLGNRSDLLAEFRSFLPDLSEKPAEEPGTQRARSSRNPPRKVQVLEHPSANVRENEVAGERSRRAREASKGKEKMDT